MHVLLLPEAELGFFHFLEIVTGWLVRSRGAGSSQYSLLTEKRFLQASKGAENTKEKSKLCFTVEQVIYDEHCKFHAWNAQYKKDWRSIAGCARTLLLCVCFGVFVLFLECRLRRRRRRRRRRRSFIALC
jgi:hypothetical protein